MSNIRDFQLKQTRDFDLALPSAKIFTLSSYINMSKNTSRTDANIGVLTIVTLENQAALQEFNINVEDFIVKENRHFYETDFPFSETINKKVVVLQSDSMGNIAISNTYQAMIRHYNLNYIVLIGIAGSIQPKMKLCDVVIATSVIYCDKRKETGRAVPERRTEIFNPSFRMNQIFNFFFTKHSEPS